MFCRNACTQSSDNAHWQVSCVHASTHLHTATLVFINICTHPAGPPCMSWSGFVSGAADAWACCCVVGRPPWSNFTGQAARPRWPTPHLRYLRPQKAPRDVRHSKLHRLERLRRMVAVQRRDLIDPRWLWNGAPPKPGPSSGTPAVKKLVEL